MVALSGSDEPTPGRLKRPLYLGRVVAH
jgi:hypothetical protein